MHLLAGVQIHVGKRFWWRIHYLLDIKVPLSAKN